MKELTGSASFRKRNPHLFPTQNTPAVSVETSGKPVREEACLHNDILIYCKAHRWIALHGSMAHKTFRVPGEPDYILLASDGRTFFIECKKLGGKPSQDQQAMIAWAASLGHTIHLVHTYSEFLDVVETSR